jgi:hypothetical protein
VWPLQNARNPIDTLIRIIQSRSLKREDLQHGCPLNNLSQEMSPLNAGFRKRTAFEFPCPSRERWRSCVDVIHKTQKKWNGAGTFGFLVTLKKHERKNGPQGWRGLSWRTDYD